MLLKIHQRINIDPSKDLSYLDDPNQIKYVENMVKKGNCQEAKSIRDQFPYSSDHLVNILE